MDAGLDAEALEEDAALPPPDSGQDSGQSGDQDGGHEPGQDAATPLCTATDEHCTDGVAWACRDGLLEMHSCSSFGCNREGSACATLMPSNVEPSLFVGTSSAWEISSNEMYDTDVCMSGTRAMQRGVGTQEVCVRQVTTMSVAAEATLRVVGARPLVILAQQNVMIEGVIDVSAIGVTPGAGGGLGGSPSLPDGIGASPGIRGASSDTSSSGGGGGGFCGTGGLGGAGGGISGGSGGSSAFPADYALEPLRGGSGGGFAPGDRPGPRDASARGGAGGGAIQISSRGTLIVRGAILAGGGGGRGGGATNAGDLGAGGGGGSGGGVLLEAMTMSFGPGARVWTTGGGGGGGANRSDTLHEGGPGQNGRMTGHRAAGGASGGLPQGAAGGRSGGGPMPNGGPGGPNPLGGANGGGGGGGVGCIVLRTATGEQPMDLAPFSSSSAIGLRSFVAHHD